MHTDYVGSTILVTKADGTKFEEILYKSFGEIYKFWKEASWHEPGTEDFTEIGSYAFTGQELDPETGLYYYGARYYNPNIGRFISADSEIDGVFTTQGFNRYTYAQNNPVNYSDPSGNFWFLALLIVVIVPSVTSTVVNSINNGAFTPTLSLNFGVFNCSVAYNTETGDKTYSAGVGIGLGSGVSLGVNISATFDTYGNFKSGNIGIGVNFSKGGFGAGLGIGANFNGDGKYTGFSVNASAGYTAGGKTSIGSSLNGAYTWNKDGSQSSSVGVGVNGGYGFSSMSVGLNYNSDGSYTGTGSYNYDYKKAQEYEEEQERMYGSAQDRQNQQITENRDDVESVAMPANTDDEKPVEAGKGSLSDEGLALLQDLEDSRLQPYNDKTGKTITKFKEGATIGYGHLIKSKKEFKSFKNGITKERALSLLKNDIAEFEDIVNNRLINLNLSVNQSQFDALVIQAFNTVSGNLHVMKAISSSSDNLKQIWLTHWDTSRGKSLPGLQNRRLTEYNLYTTGKYQRY